MNIVEELGLVINGPAYISDGYGKPVTGKVINITQTGRVVVKTSNDYNYRFNNNGREINNPSVWRSATLIDRADFERRVKNRKLEMLQKTLQHRLNEVGSADINDIKTVEKLRTFANELQTYQETK